MLIPYLFPMNMKHCAENFISKNFQAFCQSLLAILLNFLSCVLSSFRICILGEIIQNIESAELFTLQLILVCFTFSPSSHADFGIIFQRKIILFSSSNIEVLLTA